MCTNQFNSIDLLDIIPVKAAGTEALYWSEVHTGVVPPAPVSPASPPPNPPTDRPHIINIHYAGLRILETEACRCRGRRRNHPWRDTRIPGIPQRPLGGGAGGEGGGGGAAWRGRAALVAVTGLVAGQVNVGCPDTLPPGSRTRHIHTGPQPLLHM